MTVFFPGLSWLSLSICNLFFNLCICYKIEWTPEYPYFRIQSIGSIHSHPFVHRRVVPTMAKTLQYTIFYIWMHVEKSHKLKFRSFSWRYQVLRPCWGSICRQLRLQLNHQQTVFCPTILHPSIRDNFIWCKCIRCTILIDCFCFTIRSMYSL